MGRPSACLKRQTSLRAGQLKLLTARRLRSCRPLGNVDHDGCRSLVEEALDELSERVRIFKACSRVEARHPEKFPVALDASVYPPCPNFLAPSPCLRFLLWPRPFLRFSCCLEISARRSRMAFALLSAVLMSRNCLLEWVATSGLRFLAPSSGMP